MATRTLYLIRHGEYDWDDQPTPHKGLTRRGRKQARLTARRLRTLPATAIYSSDLRRAVETAEIIRGEFEGIGHEKSRTLRECTPSMPNHVPPPSVFARIPPEVIEAGRAQAEAAFARHFRPARGRDKHEIIVSHGNLIRYLTCRALAAPDYAWLNLRTLNCGISAVTIEANGRMWVECYNDVGHLPPHLTTAGLHKRFAKDAGPLSAG